MGGMHNVIWAKTKLPNFLGGLGLGIGNFHKRNLALLAKMALEVSSRGNLSFALTYWC